MLRSHYARARTRSSTDDRARMRCNWARLFLRLDLQFTFTLMVARTCARVALRNQSSAWLIFFCCSATQFSADPRARADPPTHITNKHCLTAVDNCSVFRRLLLSVADVAARVQLYTGTCAVWVRHYAYSWLSVWCSLAWKSTCPLTSRLWRSIGL